MRNNNFSTGAIDQIMVFIIVVLVTFVWMLFLMIDYWSIIKTKDRLDVVTQEAAHWLSEEPSLGDGNTNRMINLKNYLQAVIGYPVLMTVIRTGDQPTGEIDVETSTIYKMHNYQLMGDKNITSRFHTYSLHDQNGSYRIDFN